MSNGLLLQSRILVLIILLCSLQLPKNLSAQFTFSGEIRPRFEFNHGYQNLINDGEKAGAIFTQRSRLNLDYTHEVFSTKLIVQDVRVWGDQAQLALSDEKGVFIHQAWAKLNICDDIGLKFGRQEWIYDGHRLLGNVEWLQQARSHDGILFELDKQGWKFHAGTAYNNDVFDLTKTPYTIPGYRSLSFLWLNKKFVEEKIEMSLIGIANGIENDSDTMLYFTGTVGSHLIFKSNDLSGFATFYYQFGKLPNNVSVSAFLAAASLKYTINKAALNVGVDFISGNNSENPSKNDKSRAFNTLYATNHKFYGWMDYFLNIPAHTAGGGLIDLQLGASAKIKEKSTLTATAHYFLLANNVADPVSPGVSLSRGLGMELDAVYSLNIHKTVNLKVGMSVLAPTNSLEAIDAGTKGRFNTWAWSMITFKPVFFKSKEKDIENP